MLTPSNLLVIRMCIAMAWPPEPGQGETPVLELARTDNPRLVTHNDIHNGNGGFA